MNSEESVTNVLPPSLRQLSPGIQLHVLISKDIPKDQRSGTIECRDFQRLRRRQEILPRPLPHGPPLSLRTILANLHKGGLHFRPSRPPFAPLDRQTVHQVSPDTAFHRRDSKCQSEYWILGICVREVRASGSVAESGEGVWAAGGACWACCCGWGV